MVGKENKSFSLSLDNENECSRWNDLCDGFKVLERLNKQFWHNVYLSLCRIFMTFLLAFDKDVAMKEFLIGFRGLRSLCTVFALIALQEKWIFLKRNFSIKLLY